MSNSIINLLRRLNSKERFFLVGAALGNPEFLMDPGFRERLGNAIGLEAPIPADAFCAMDYHLDWIHAAIHADQHNLAENDPVPNTSGAIKGTQQDVDLLVAFQGEDGLHMIFIEAKATTGWSSEQADLKMQRLGTILGTDNHLGRQAGVIPHYVLMSPGKRPSDRLRKSEWPKWMLGQDGLPVWLDLPIPNRNQLLQVSRCDEKSNATKIGDCWMLTQRK